MDVVGISQSVQQEVQNNTTTGSSTLDKDSFLELLVTQMKYQDPLNPMDNSEMAAQLAQFSQVEALNNIEATLNDQILLNQSLNNSFMTSMIGKDVKAYGNGVSFDNKDTEIEFYLSGDADVTVSIFDSDGNKVTSIDAGNLRYGDQNVVWNGKDSEGNTVDSGNYTFTIEARNDLGNEVQAYGYNTGFVSGITYENGSPYLLVNGQKVNLGDIISILYAEDNPDPSQPDTTIPV